jgi:hypothetical protein
VSSIRIRIDELIERAEPLLFWLSYDKAAVELSENHRATGASPHPRRACVVLAGSSYGLRKHSPRATLPRLQNAPEYRSVICCERDRMLHGCGRVKQQLDYYLKTYLVALSA